MFTIPIIIKFYDSISFIYIQGKLSLPSIVVSNKIGQFIFQKVAGLFLPYSICLHRLNACAFVQISNKQVKERADG